jgi:hypothetical protein
MTYANDVCSQDVAVQFDAANLESDQTNDVLDRQLAEAEALVMHLRQRKNERAPVSRLPVEILIQVFSYYCASDRYPHTRFRTPPPWLAVTHVCQRWRDAALSCPFLWDEIISTNHRWAEEMLRRSRDVPIHITIDDGGNTQKPCELRTARLLFTEIHRTQSLVMTSAHTILSCMSILFEAEAAPLLQELIITNFHPTSALDLIARPLFDGKTPNLQLLSLYRCRVLWSSPLLQCDLVYLSISHIPHEHRPHLDLVLEVLKRLARLECLQLDESLHIHISSPNESITSLLSVERLFLYRLRFFSLCAHSALDILALTARVLVPASALFQLICEEFERYTPSTDSGDVMLAALASHLCAPRDTSTTSGSADLWAPVRILHVRDIPAARSWSLFAGTGGPADVDTETDDNENDSDDGQNAQSSRHQHHHHHHSLRSTSTSNNSTDGNKANADVPPPNPAEEQMHILSLHLRWHSYPSSARAAASFIERAARLPPLVRASTLLIESALFDSGSAWRAAFARSRHVRAVFAGGDKAAASAAQMLRDVGQHPHSHPRAHQALMQFRSGQEASSADADAHAHAHTDAVAHADASVYAAIARLLPSHFVFERPAERPSRVLLPKLRRLAIAGANFEDVEVGLFESLRSGLLARKEAESGPLTQLSIWRCDVLKEQLDVLGALVTESKVRWDGVLNATSPSPQTAGGDGLAQRLASTHANTGQGSDWPNHATIVEESEVGNGDGDLPSAEGQSPLLLPGELDGLDEG